METKRYTGAFLRRCTWRSLKIMRKIIVPELVAGIEGISDNTARKLLRQLHVHGYIAKTGATREDYPEYTAASSVAVLPAKCEACGQPFTVKKCSATEEKREKEKEREREREQAEWNRSGAGEALTRLESEVSHDAA